MSSAEQDEAAGVTSKLLKLIDAASELHNAHLAARLAAQSVSDARAKQMRREVRLAADDLLAACSLDAVDPSDLFK